MISVKKNKEINSKQSLLQHPTEIKEYVEEITSLKEKIAKLESMIFSIGSLPDGGKEILSGYENLPESPARYFNPDILFHNNLSSRELEVMHLVSEGNTDKEIATKIFISVNTVKTHLRRIYEKLHVKNRTEAVMKLNS